MADAKDAPANPPSRPDFATLGGLVLAIGGIAGGLVVEGGRLQDLAQLSAAMIVLGGTIGSLLPARIKTGVLTRAACSVPRASEPC